MNEIASYCEGRVVVISGDITQLSVDAIVNAANSSLLGGGGVDGAIHSAGGSAILDECRELRRATYPEGLPTGEAVVTTGGNLPCKHVIHTVGPVWRGGEHGEDELLAKAYNSSLVLAGQLSVSSLAFPAISTGVYGFPKNRAAPIVLSTISSYCGNNAAPAVVYLVFFAAGDGKSFVEAIG